ncbi:MAG: glycoside hydrolase family protein [Candidatus Marsarchaeota archaeon]|nr:glycoside hydrolase family protein [Candidatus Marsarchaeota archaeon]
MGRTAMAIVLLAIVISAAAYVFFNGYKSQGAASNSAYGSGQFSQRFCVNGAGNATLLQYAIGNGIDCFRTDITLKPGQAAFIRNATAEGAQFLGILDYDTVGAQPSPGGCVSGCNWTLSDWNASVADAIAEYPGVREWEIYNEPLAQIFVSGYDNGSALDYFNMIKSAYRIIKGRDPNATVVCFGGAEMYPVQSVEYEYAFYSKVWSYGASKYCDAISLHAYSLPYYSLDQQIGGNLTLGQLYGMVLNLYENLTGKPVWITETGITSNNWAVGLNLSVQKQAMFLEQDLLFLSRYSFVRRIYWFSLIDSGGQDYGLISGAMQPKPAFYSFLNFSGRGTR